MEYGYDIYDSQQLGVAFLKVTTPYQNGQPILEGHLGYFPSQAYLVRFLAF